MRGLSRRGLMLVLYVYFGMDMERHVYIIKVYFHIISWAQHMSECSRRSVTHSTRRSAPDKLFHAVDVHLKMMSGQGSSLPTCLIVDSVTKKWKHRVQRKVCSY